MGLLLLIALVAFLHKGELFCRADPTDGFTSVPLTEDNIELEKPYDIPLEQRYSYVDGVRTLWVYSDDKPLRIDSPTKPRTEIRIIGLDYSSGVWQFEGYGFVPNGTTGVSIMQIHGAAHGNTTLMLRIYDGDLRNYVTDTVATDMYNRWFRINVIHDVDQGVLTVFVDGNQKYQAKDHGPGDLYFKCGVYAQNNASFYMESRWKDIKIYTK
ncbi:hypothetical protein ACHQM5_023225 [Ranunculus cassubicifolius]